MEETQFQKANRKMTLMKTLRVLVEGKDNTREFLSNVRQYTDLDVPDYDEIVELYESLEGVTQGKDLEERPPIGDKS